MNTEQTNNDNVNIEDTQIFKYREVLAQWPENHIKCVKLLREKIPGLGLADAVFILQSSHTRIEEHFKQYGTLIGFADITGSRALY